MKLLRRTQFGNPILRTPTHRLSQDEILSPEIQGLIKNMYHTVDHKNYGVGLAAPQVGRSVAIAVIAIKPTPTRPDLVPQKLTIINPEVISSSSVKKSMWEACISFGGTSNTPYAQAVRHTQIRLRWHNESGHTQEADFDGFMAQVIQHEVDHLNGILFVDRVEDTHTFMTLSEYKNMRKNT